MSTTEPCPNCEGFCCRADSGMTVQHRSSRYAKHVCPDCDAGLVWTAHPEPAPRPVWTAEQERAAFVAYLRKRVVRSYAQGTIPGTNGCEARTILEAVERGDHLTEKKP